MTVIAANAGRYPVSSQCEILGVPRSTYCAMRGRAEPAEAPDPAAEVATAFEESRGRYGARKIKASLARRGIVLGRRRIGRIMKGRGPGQRLCRRQVQAEPLERRRGRRPQHRQQGV